jgi:hypothetical protein
VFVFHVSLACQHFLFMYQPGGFGVGWEEKWRIEKVVFE